MSLRDEFLSNNDLPLLPIKVWGKELFVRPLGADDQFDFDMETGKILRANPTWTDEDKSKSHIGRLVVRTLVDADGARVFEDGDAEAVRKKNGMIVLRIYNLAVNSTAFSEENIAEMVKNSEAGRS